MRLIEELEKAKARKRRERQIKSAGRAVVRTATRREALFGMGGLSLAAAGYAFKDDVLGLAREVTNIPIPSLPSFESDEEPVNPFADIDNDVRVISAYLTQSSDYGPDCAQVAGEIGRAVKDFYTQDNASSLPFNASQMFSMMMFHAMRESRFGKFLKGPSAEQSNGVWSIWGIYHHQKDQWGIRLKEGHAPDSFEDADKITIRDVIDERGRLINRLAVIQDAGLQRRIMDMRGDPYISTLVECSYKNAIQPTLRAKVEEVTNLDDISQLRIGPISMYAEHVFGMGIGARIIESRFDSSHRNNVSIVSAIGSDLASNNFSLCYERRRGGGVRELTFPEVFDRLAGVIDEYNTLRRRAYELDARQSALRSDPALRKG